MTSLQPITYRGRTLAAATPERVFLGDELEDRPRGDPELTWVIYMAFCARDVLTGELPGPYTDADASIYARAALIPDEVLERPAPAGEDRLARGLGVPLHELRIARADHTRNAGPHSSTITTDVASEPS